MGDDSSSSSSVVVIDNDAINSKKSSSSSIFLQIVEHPDGSITRPTVPNLPPDVNPNSPVLSKDLPLNPTHHTKLRLYLPNPPPPPPSKLPVVVYYHGGGFVLFSPDFLLYHQFCNKMAEAIPALVVSLDYRLSPEHRLPAAYEDAVEAIQWVKHSSDPWIMNHADLSRCFVMGSSSGGNMAYFAGLRAANVKLDPLRICGLVLIQPYFGGENRTRSEMESEEDDTLPLRANDMMWRLALPKGGTTTASRDHEYCNPVMNPAPADAIRRLPATMVMGCRGDPLFDRQKMFVEMFEKAAPGVTLVAHLDDDNHGYHAVELFDAVKAQQLLAQIKHFVASA